MLSTIFLILAGQAAPAAAPASPDLTVTAKPVRPAKPARAAADPTQRICRVENDTGSLMDKRTCRTRAEWDSLRVMEERYRDQFRIRATNNALPRGS